MTKFMKKLILILPFLFLFSCGTNTTIVNSWKDPETTIASEQFKKIFVVALVKNESVRRTTENRIASLDERFHASYPFLNETTQKLTMEEKLKILQDENYDGVVTMRLVDTQKETNYVPGTTNYTYGPYGGYGGYYGGAFGGWYGSYSTYYYDPGYYEETTYFIVETNIFSLKKNKLIWSGISKSANVDDIGKTVDEIIYEIMKVMKEEGSIPK